ncbi:hypothetical protein GCM10009795_016810 [Nocardioides hankookensis]|uniref:OmpA-like domain-containing protein n=1 Tax=Nocardioides hankookensis TaxID=443157 RepID=A0ABW1LIP9_9ACTN
MTSYPLLEAEDPPKVPINGDLMILTGLGSQGFDTEPVFRRGWWSLLLKRKVETKFFRSRFCKARHVRARVNGVDRTYAIVLGFPIEYAPAVTGKILLKQVGSPDIVDRLMRSGRRVVAPLPCPQPIPRRKRSRAYGVTVLFSPPGSSAVGAREQQRLYSWYTALPPAVRTKIKQGRLIISLEGFTSTTQPSAANKRLSQRRVVQVRNALMGVIGPGARYTLYPYGEARAKTRDNVEDPKERRVRVSVIDL